MTTALALAFALLAQDIAEEGRNIIIVMLVTGLIFLAVIALGQLSRWLGHRRRAKRPRPY
ncbi:MAG: hypothetical protein KY396_00345 [Actinobacteria bacterium]|nr:hypothetical protein [Actinomycetota bacterium]